MIKNIASEIATLIGKKPAKTAEKTEKPAPAAVGLPDCEQRRERVSARR
jgi:hypothetical protein